MYSKIYVEKFLLDPCLSHLLQIYSQRLKDEGYKQEPNRGKGDKSAPLDDPSLQEDWRSEIDDLNKQCEILTKQHGYIIFTPVPTKQEDKSDADAPANTRWYLLPLCLLCLYRVLLMNSIYSP